MKIKSVVLMALVGASTVQARNVWDRLHLAQPVRNHALLAAVTFGGVAAASWGIDLWKNSRATVGEPSKFTRSETDFDWIKSKAGNESLPQGKIRNDATVTRNVETTRNLFWDTTRIQEKSEGKIIIEKDFPAASLNQEVLNNKFPNIVLTNTKDVATFALTEDSKLQNDETYGNYLQTNTITSRNYRWGRIGFASAAALAAVVGRLAYTRTR